ncbi:hypothetical protein HDU98_004660, partial [Podochytrium sp. JEL0797]
MIQLQPNGKYVEVPGAVVVGEGRDGGRLKIELKEVLGLMAFSGAVEQAFQESTFLKKTKWGESLLLMENSPQDLLPLLEQPAVDSPLQQIQPICALFLESVNKMLGEPSSLVLRNKIKARGSSRYIHEIDESVDEGISGKSFKAIKNESVQQYSRVLSHLILFELRLSLRDPDTNMQPRPQELRDALKSFLEALKLMDPLEPLPESIILRLVLALRIVLFEDIGLDGLLNKPRVHLVEEFLLVKSLREGGSFKPTKAIKQIISPLLFSARAVCLFGIVEATRNDQLTATARK